METIEERIQAAQAKKDRLERQQRVEARQEREAQKKLNQRRNYIIGEMVSQKFPKVLELQPGSNVENEITFAPFQAFLEVLAADAELVQELSERAALKVKSADVLSSKFR